MKSSDWEQKYQKVRQHQVKVPDKKFADILPGEKMLIATPAIIEEYIRQLPEGTGTDLGTLRRDLAATYHTDKTCPVTTAIYLRIVAERAYLQHQEGKDEITPVWRIIDSNAPIAGKISFPFEFIAERRKAEGLQP